jgi:uncharacterized membrane protein
MKKSDFMTPEQGIKEIEYYKRLFRLEKKKFVCGVFWIILVLIPLIYWKLFPVALTQEEFPIFLFIFSVLFALLLVGVNQLVNGLTSNAVENEDFQNEIKTKLGLLLSEEKKPTPEKQRGDTMIVENKRSPDFISAALIVIFILVYIGYLMFVMSQHPNSDLYITTIILAIPSFFVAVVTSVYVLLTRELIKTNQDLVDAQSQPSVIAHVKENDDDFHFIDLVIENVGMGIARDIHFDVLPHGFITISGDPLETLPVIQNGIPALGPKQKFRMILCNLTPLTNRGLPLSEIHDTLKFRIGIKYQNSLGIEKNWEYYDIDLGIFWGLRYLRTGEYVPIATDSSGNVPTR